MVTRFLCGSALVSFLLIAPIVHADAISDLLEALGTPVASVQATSTSAQIQAQLQKTQSATESVQPLIVPLNSIVPPSGSVPDPNAQKIAELTNLIEQLKAQLVALLAQKVSTPVVSENVEQSNSDESAVTDCPQLVRKLGIGSLGDDVRCAQRLLVAAKFLPTANISGFFDDATESAVQQFQIDREIVFDGKPGTTGFGLVGKKTRDALNGQISQLGTLEQNQDEIVVADVDAPIIRFNPTLSNKTGGTAFTVIPELASTFSLRISSHQGGVFEYSIDWGDGTQEQGSVKSGAEKQIRHTFAAGAYNTKVSAHDELGLSEEHYIFYADPIGDGGQAIQITSPEKGWTIDLVTLIPVSAFARDPRATGIVRWYLQKGPTEHVGTGLLLGETPMVGGVAEGKFSLKDAEAGTYWIQAVGDKFQDCATTVCKVVLPTHRVGPITVSDVTGLKKNTSDSVSSN